MKKSKSIKGLLMLSLLVSQGAIGQPPQDLKRALRGDNPSPEELTARRLEAFSRQWVTPIGSKQAASFLVANQATVSQANAPVQSAVNQAPLLCKLPPVQGEKPILPVKSQGDERPEKKEDAKNQSDETSKPQGEQNDLAQKVAPKGRPSVWGVLAVGLGYVGTMGGAFGYLFYTHLWPVIEGYVAAAYEQWVAISQRAESVWSAAVDGCDWIYGALGLERFWPLMHKER